MKKNKTQYWAIAAVIFVVMLSSCQKTVPDVVATTDDEFAIQEQDETALWLQQGNVAEKETGDHARVKVFATGLNNPRGLKFSPTGRLYVAEAGDGGTGLSTVGQCEQVPFPVGPYLGGATGGRISRINWQGVRQTVTDKLPSSHANEIIGGDVEGVSAVAFIGHTLYAVLAGAGCSHGVAEVPNMVLKVRPNGTWKMVANLSQWFMAHPVQNPEADDFEPDGTPYSMVNVEGTLYIMEPNHGDFIKVSTEGNIKRVVDISAKFGHIVPTALTFKGNFFMGNLHTFPIVEGSSNIYRITPSGQVEIYATGFTTVLGVAFDKKDRMYVLENTTGNPFPTPGTGRIVRVEPSGQKKVIVTGLSLPTAMTFGPDGKIYVSNVGFGPQAIGGGQIIQVTLGN